MFGNKETRERESAPSVLTRQENTGSVIGERVSMNGTLRVEGSIVIHGEVEGSINCSGELVVGKTGRVKADLDVGSAIIAGRVEGKIVAKGRVELQTNSHLTGDVNAKSFVIQDGCFFQGNCTMGVDTAPAREEEPEPPRVEVA
jgi:cytoskeletal protein CcmA (bactofilin family)